jgi:hypothetical protein
MDKRGVSFADIEAFRATQVARWPVIFASLGISSL